jgi:hypothetical protein
MNKKVIFAAALGLCIDAIAAAQLPTPTNSASRTTGFATGTSPPATMPTLELPAPTAVGVPCRPALCTPAAKPKTKTVYSTITREYCQPSRSLFDTILAKCGLLDDCDAVEVSGETRTKTLLVKKAVPKCETPARPSADAAAIRPPSVSVYPMRP